MHDLHDEGPLLMPVLQLDMNRSMRFPAMLFVRPAKVQTNLRIRAV